MADPNVSGAALPLNSPELAVLPVLATLALICTAPAVPAAVFAWRGRWWTPALRAAYSLLAAAALGFFAVAFAYNLLLF